MFSYIFILASTIFFITPKLELVIRKNIYNIILSSTLLAYIFLGWISLFLISIGQSKFSILAISITIFFLSIFADKEIKRKFIILKKITNIELKKFLSCLDKNKISILFISFLLLIIIASSIGPINHPDSIDYHIGYPYQYWLHGNFFIDGGLQQGLVGIGDYANLSFIQEKNIWLVRTLQIIPLPVITIFFLNNLNKKYLIIALLSSPIIIQWSTIGKPLFLGESVCAFSYIFWKINKDNYSRTLILSSIISCISIKISALIVVFPIFIDLLLDFNNSLKNKNLKHNLFIEIKNIFNNKIIIFSMIILISIFLSRYIISGNFMYPLLTNFFNKDDFLIKEFTENISSYRRDIFYLINLFIPLRISEINHSLGPSFIFLIIISIISNWKDKLFIKNGILTTSISQVVLLLLFCQGRGDYYSIPFILFLYSAKDLRLKGLLKFLNFSFVLALFLQLIIISIFFTFSIKQNILSFQNYEEIMNQVSFGYHPSKFVDEEKEGNVFFAIGRDIRLFYPKNYISTDEFNRCLKTNDQNYCLKKYNITQTISSGNSLINQEEFQCSYKNIIKGSRNPLNRKKIKLEICKRNSPNK